MEKMHVRFIGVVRKTFRLRTVFLLQTLMPPSYFRNIIMTSGIAANPPTVGIKKWQTFSCSYEFGYKGYNLIFTEKGQEDQALLEIAKTMFPLTQIEGTSWKLEPLMTVPDSLKVLG